MTFSQELLQFLKQASSTDLKTKHYLKKYKELEVKVSFGQGNQARIPWISFLKPPNTVSNGIYPVYLYYKENELLILAYGVSETNPPKTLWGLNTSKSIKEHFNEKKLGKPERYGSSLIYKIYEVNNMPDNIKLDHDLNEIIKKYYSTTSTDDLVKDSITKTRLQFNPKAFNEKLLKAGLIFSNKHVSRFISSLITKPFVLLSGLSGSGKTKLAQAFALWICQDENQYSMISVGADWTNRESLLGYPNALDNTEYILPENGALELIIRAYENKHLPYFLILDEMNLSHVERYFADFLSVMESKESITLYTGEKRGNVPPSLIIPPNLFIIGTVNIDETTYMFSPKVLDRANAIEFRVNNEDLQTFFSNNLDVDLEALKSQGQSMANSFVELAINKQFEEQDLTGTHSILLQFFDQLKKTGAEFGFRSASEILRLINQLTIIDPALSPDEKLDIAIMQKLLPKLHGSRRKLSPILKTLASFCLKEDKVKEIEKEIFNVDDFKFGNTDIVKYPISLEKIIRMFKGAVDNGFASYAEA